MLWALALLGVLPAAFSIDDMTSKQEDNDTTDRDDVETDAETRDDLLDEAVIAPIDETLEKPTEDPNERIPFEVVANGGTTTLTDFSATEDTLVMHFPDDAYGTFASQNYQDEHGEEAGVSLQYTDGDSVTAINFAGHTELPTDRISISLVDEQTGEQGFFALEPELDAPAITPNDPEAPEMNTPSENPDAVPISAEDPEAPEISNASQDPNETPILPTPPEVPDVVTEHVLSGEGETLVLSNDPFNDGDDAAITTSSGTPNIETQELVHSVTGSDGDDVIATGDAAAIVNAGLGDDTLYAGDGSAILNGSEGNDTLHGSDNDNAHYFLNGGVGDDQLLGRDAGETLRGGAGADVLSGGAGNDTLILDQDDIASGGAGEDVFVLENTSSLSPDAVVTITDFEASTDLLQLVAQSGDFDSDSAELQVEISEDGLSSHVLVNGDLVAVLQGAPTVTANDIVFAAAS